MPVMVTAGTGAPDDASWLGVNSRRLPVSFSTHRSPDRSKATLPGSSRLDDERVTIGVGSPVEASWDGVYSTTLPPKLAIHRSPDASKASVPKGPFRLDPSDEMLTAGVASPVADSG